MGTTTAINWCHHTFNPWRGCTPVSAGCDHCYARNDLSVKLHGIKWGPNERRVIKAESGWSEPHRWNRAAEKAGERRRVFCGSLMDVFEDRPELVLPRERLFNVIYVCRDLDWLLLTKRPKVAARFFGGSSGMGYATLESEFEHVWLGASVENQGATRRIRDLCRIPAAVRFLSIEPTLGPIDFQLNNGGGEVYDALTAYVTTHRGHSFRTSDTHPIDWVIVGGESGPNCRPFEWDWARKIRDQCQAAGVAFWMKQGGGHPHKRDRLEDLPIDLRIRELPRPLANPAVAGEEKTDGR